MPRFTFSCVGISDKIFDSLEFYLGSDYGIEENNVHICAACRFLYGSIWFYGEVISFILLFDFFSSVTNTFRNNN